MMDNIVKKISYAMSLRDPQIEALSILNAISSEINFKSHSNNDSDRLSIKEKSLEVASRLCENPRKLKVTDEFSFPSFCFEMATGIGKTRLMGASIYYLYKTKGYRHFFILAPGDTIYEKLRKESQPEHPKYLFKGLEAELGSRPKVYDGENYLRYNDDFNSLLKHEYHNEIEIFIFNIGKIFTPKTDKTFKFHSYKETLGKSFADVLSNFDDLVICMDEAHRYYAPQSLKAIDYLKPILGLEFTATPKSNSNVIYSYDLAKGAGKYLKIPVMNGRTNMSGYSDEDIEEMKLKDGVTLHENRKLTILKYCNDNNLDYVKPIILVACKDTIHANKVREKIESKDFFDGKYKNKVIEVHSGQTGSSETNEDIIYKLLTIEKQDNPVEIVLHVYKLKEGWDVNNLFTIIPLNAAKSEILAMQTIGRGLRLPFGQITGEENIDTLDIVAHEHYREIVEELKANPIFKTRDLDEKPIEETKQVLIEPDFGNIQPSLFDELFSFDEDNNKVVKENLEDPYVIEKLYREYLKTVGSGDKKDLPEKGNQIDLFNFNQEGIMIQEPTTQDLKTIALQNGPILDKTAFIEKVKKYQTTAISVPKISIQPTTKVELVPIKIKKSIDFIIEESQIERFNIANNTLLESIDVEILEDPNPANTLACLMLDKISEFDSNDADYILDIVDQYLIEIGGDDQHKKQIVRKYASLILDDIRVQVNSAIKSDTTFNYQIKKASIVFGKQLKNIKPLGEVNLHKEITDKINIKKYLYTGYKKSYYEKNGFDSDAERKLSVVLESDDKVIRWIKPPLNQLGIYYSAGSQYNPDFLVETLDAKYMIEVKEERELDNKEVQLKKAEGELWCKYASIVDADSKKWKYRLISDKHIHIGDSLNTILGLSSNPNDMED